MKQMFIIYATLLLACTINNNAQAQNADNIQRYIERYRSLAMSEQQRTGIPAAIKLAQGIHETGAGTSPLALQANNHFGLKCKSGWTGGTFMHTDDRRNECFRKYNMDFESYQDQSNYLKDNPRYASLFNLSITDYAAWAMGLRQAGYATNPKYAQALIKLIEDYRLQEYTYAAMGNTAMSAPANNNNSRRERSSYQRSGQPAQNSYQQNNNSTYGTRQPANNGYARNAAPVATPPQPESTYNYGNTQPERVSKYIDTRPKERQTITRTRQNGRNIETRVDNTPSTVVKINNLKAIYGKKGDMPLQYAVRNKIRYEKFLEINDLKEEPLVADMPLYLERKHFWGIRPMHLVKYGEVMIEIAQKEGIQLKYLRDLNYMEEDEEPVPGITLELQAQAGEKPKVVKRSASPVYAQIEQQESGDQGDAEDNYSGNYTQQNTQPVSTFPKNPAPVYQEEKSLFEKIKESRLAKKLLKEEEAKKEAMASSQQKPQSTPPPTQQQSKYVQQTPAQSQQSKYIQNTPPAQQQQVAQQPVQSQQSQYIQRTPQPAQQQQVARQPVQSYGNQQRSAQNTYATPNPAAQVVEEKSARELRREARERRKKEEEEKETPVVQKQTAPQQQKPKTELDLLKEQFDDVIYAQNNNQAAQAPQRQQHSYQQNQRQRTQQTYQQPQQQQPIYQQQQYQQQTYQQPQQNQYQAAQQPQYQQQQPAYQQPQRSQQTYQQPQQNQYQAQQPQYQQQYQSQQPQYQQQNQYQARGQQYQQPPSNYDPTKFYMVQRGDTAYTIAKKHGITIRQLMEWNGLDFDAIKEGQNLRVKP